MNREENAELMLRLGKLRMLVVAFDRWIRESLLFYFESLGCDTTSFESGHEAQKAFIRDQYDVIIADFTLSDMGGFDLLKNIHSAHPGKIKIYITSTDRKEIRSEADSMGVHIIEKPFTAESINDAFLAFFKEQENIATER